MVSASSLARQAEDAFETLGADLRALHGRKAAKFWPAWNWLVGWLNFGCMNLGWLNFGGSLLLEFVANLRDLRCCGKVCTFFSNCWGQKCSLQLRQQSLRRRNFAPLLPKQQNYHRNSEMRFSVIFGYVKKKLQPKLIFKGSKISIFNAMFIQFGPRHIKIPLQQLRQFRF